MVAVPIPALELQPPPQPQRPPRPPDNAEHLVAQAEHALEAQPQAVPVWREESESLPTMQQGGATQSSPRRQSAVSAGAGVAGPGPATASSAPTAGLAGGAWPQLRRSSGCSVEVLASCAPTPDFMKDPELFDFRRDPSEWRSKRFTVPCTMACVWKDKRIKMAYPSNHSDDAMSVLMLVEKEDGFCVDPAPCCRTPWLVVSGLRYALAQGDIFRVGRFSFRVRRLVASDLEPHVNLSFEDTICESSTSSESAHCRICLQCGPDADGQLIAPCDCKGSVEYVHVGCLQHWMRARTASSESKRAYTYKLQSCELCKAPYPMHYKDTEGNQLPLVLLDTPPAPYVVLEELSQARAQDLEDAEPMLNNERLGLHIASLGEGPIRLGRCRESDVEIHDEYVSRRHAVIRYEGGQFLLEDNGSKWGTLVALRDELPLDLDHTVSVQVGPAVFTLALQPRQGSLSPRSQISSGWGRPWLWPPTLFDMRARAVWLSAVLDGPRH